MRLCSLTLGAERGLHKIRDGDCADEGAKARIVSLIHLSIVVEHRLRQQQHRESTIKEMSEEHNGAETRGVGYQRGS